MLVNILNKAFKWAWVSFFVIGLCVVAWFFYVSKFSIIRKSEVLIPLDKDESYGELHLVFCTKSFFLDTYVQAKIFNGEREAEMRSIIFFDTYAEAQNVDIKLKTLKNNVFILSIDNKDFIYERVPCL